MGSEPIALLALVSLAVLSGLLAMQARMPERLRLSSYSRVLWTFALFFTAVEWLGFAVGIWVLALLAFFSLREYFSLVDIRLSDRWALLAGYLSVPAVFVLIQTDWYGFFIVSIPVYAFLLVPFLVVLGKGQPRGTVFSIGSLDFGLFLFVYCMGHVGYLTRVETAFGVLLVAAVAICDLLDRLFARGLVRNLCVRFLLAALLILPLAHWLIGMAGVDVVHCVVLSLLVPALAWTGNFTLAAIEEDLGIRADDLEPGRGRLLDAVKSHLFTAPVVFHYLRWVTEMFPT